MALRGAWLQAQCRQRGIDIDRSGCSGPLVEVYPAVAVRCWGLLPIRTRYKGRSTPAKAGRGRLVRRLEKLLPAYVKDDLPQRFLADDDELDAFLCAVVARAARKDATHEPPNELIEVARREGWIHFPNEIPLRRLL